MTTGAEGSRWSPRFSITPWRATIAIAVVSFAAQLLLVPISRPPSWDEAIYLSQVVPDVPALPFVASRARGIVLLVAPLAGTGVPLPVLRLVLAAASSAAIAGAFRLWIPQLGWGVPAGAAIFATSWLTVFYGAEVMPNLWAAILAVAATGSVVRAASAPAPERTRSLIGAGVVLCLMSLLRPPDALALAAVLSLTAVLTHRDRRLAGAVVVGAALGAVVWLVEMAVRVGGPVEALRGATAAAHLGTGGPIDRIAQHLALADGPTLGPDRGGGPAFALVWWGALIALCTVALVRPRRRGVRVAALSGAWLVVIYVGAIGGLAPRFLLPGFGLLSVAAGAGAADLWDRRGRVRGAAGPVAAGAAVLAAACLLVWNATILLDVAGRTLDARARDRDAGRAVRAFAEGQPCSLLATSSFPQLAWGSGCRTRPTRPGVDDRGWLQGRAAAGDRVFVAVRDGDQVPPSSVALGAVRLHEGEGWTIYGV